ncbi:hypothetical protein L1987_36920 [Smallanthus sonchifolius]|uniref:Uncharacterized protein n=1 Tax=Smallanthus sonchifolius TaxID=185202 RepID=A0ACB9HGA4_9ASTR|nr:hypothetical protein L1987_36920 [Smallanthus sonchifolius]
MEYNKNPHAVCIPFPAQGHINPMLKLAKILHYKGFHITFVNTEFNHQRLLKSQGSNSLNRHPSFQFETIPDGPTSPENQDVTQDIPSLWKSTSENCLEPFKALLYKLNDTETTPPVSCIVSDGIMSFTLDAADELGIPEVLLWTNSASVVLALAHYDTFRQRGIVPLKVDCIPGMKGMRLKDMPTFLRITHPDDILFNLTIRETARAKNASAIILNTFEELERDMLNELSSINPLVYSTGPLHTIANTMENENLQLLGTSLWKEDTKCLEWLDSKEPNSVVYVNFGSITVMTPEQLVEFSWGLANSNQTFLWVIRPDLVSGDSLIPRGHQKYRIAAVINGASEWSVVDRKQVENLVKTLIRGERGKEMREMAAVWKKKAHSMSSWLNIDNFINQVTHAMEYKKPHAVCIPFPAQGHINPMLKLAKILHYKGFHITFVNTEFNHQRLLKSQGSNSINRHPCFRFETIPDGLPPPENQDATQDIASLCKSTSENCLEPFKALLYKLNDTETTPPVSCIVSDGIMSFTLDAADELGIPEALFWTNNACAVLAFAHYETFRQKGIIPLKDSDNLTNGHLDTIVDCIPGMKGMHLKDMPTFVRITDPSDIVFNFAIRETARAKKALEIILNTFEELERDMLNELSLIYPLVYLIGPLHTIANTLENEDLKLLGSSLWKEETKCLEWLDSKEPNSVVYVNFGSITVMTPE